MNAAIWLWNPFINIIGMFYVAWDENILRYFNLQKLRVLWLKMFNWCGKNKKKKNNNTVFYNIRKICTAHVHFTRAMVVVEGGETRGKRTRKRIRIHLHGGEIEINLFCTFKSRVFRLIAHQRFWVNLILFYSPFVIDLFYYNRIGSVATWTSKIYLNH